MDDITRGQIQQLLAFRKHHGGKIYWVNTSSGGSDDANNSGLSWQAPLATIARAHALCTSGKNDYIIVIDAWTGDTEPIVITKTHIHLLGIDNPHTPYICLSATGDTDVLQIASGALNCEISGLSFGGGATHGGILLNAPTGTWIHHCNFGHNYAGNTPLYGISGDGSTNCADTLIENCRFYGTGNNSQGTITGNGISITSAGNTFVNSIVRKNVFLGIPGIAISLDHVLGVEISDNKIAMDADTLGAAITMGASCLGCWVDGNSANFGDTAAVNNPYVDAAAAGANSWGINIKAGVTIMPS